MKRTMFWTLVLSLYFVPMGRAQTVTGSGTTGNIAKFTGSSMIGNSVIVESNGNIGIGTANPVFPLHVRTSNITPPLGQSNPIGLWVDSEGSSDSNAVIAIEGLAGSVSGQQIGVNGTAFSPDGTGVLGNHPGNEGGGTGVRGQTSSVTGFSVGTAGVAGGASGPGVGIFGQAFSPQGVAGLFANVAGGDIIVGGVGQPETNVFRVDGRGTVFADGGFRPFGADFAESIAVSGNVERYAPGDLLVIDPSSERRLSLSQTPYSTLVAGIYSTQPGVVASQHRANEALAKDEVPLAVVGIVPCKVTAENGPIVAGDLLVTSSIPGHAMKGTDRSRMLGAVVGKALEPLQKGTGVIQVLVTLQ